MSTIEVYLNQNDIEKVLDAVLDALDASQCTAKDVHRAWETFGWDTEPSDLVHRTPSTMTDPPEPEFSREEILAAAVFEQARAFKRTAKALEEAGVDLGGYYDADDAALRLVAARISVGDL